MTNNNEVKTKLVFTSVVILIFAIAIIDCKSTIQAPNTTEIFLTTPTYAMPDFGMRGFDDDATISTAEPQVLTAPPVSIKAEDAYYMVGYYEYGGGFSLLDGLCLYCHAQGVGYSEAQPGLLLYPGGNQYPLPPTWQGSPNMPGNWIILEGSEADHTGRTVDSCLQCHQAPEDVNLQWAIQNGN
jgi:hypothetical protein